MGIDVSQLHPCHDEISAIADPGITTGFDEGTFISLLWPPTATLEERGRHVGTAAPDVTRQGRRRARAVFVRPLFFFDRTPELHMRADVPQVIAEKTRRVGMKELELIAEAPERAVENGYVQESDTLGPGLHAQWSGSAHGGLRSASDRGLPLITAWMRGAEAGAGTP